MKTNGMMLISSSILRWRRRLVERRESSALVNYAREFYHRNIHIAC
jgi:hypothetical protein